MKSPLTRTPNIILLVMDTVRADHCSAWGYHRRTTPFLEELAQTSTTYSRAIAPSSWTLPVHTSLFTGMYPSEHGVLSDRDHPGKDLPLLAEILKTQGYLTAGFSNNPWASSFRDLDRGFDVFEEIFRGRRAEDKTLLKKNIDRLTHLLFLNDNGADKTNRKIQQFLNNLPRSENQPPIFLFVNYMEAHQVYNPKIPYHRNFEGGLNSLYEMVQNRNIARQQAAVFAGWRELSNDHYRAMINMYDRAISYLDSQIENLIAQLDQRLDPENTLLIITSDHGENFGEHKLNDINLIDHIFSLHDSLTHVPLMIRFPRGIRVGPDVDDPVQLQDLFHLILNILGISDPNKSQWWQNSILKDSPRNYAISELFPRYMLLDRFKEDCRGESFDPFYTSIQSIETQNRKLILFDKHPAEFYNIAADPGEQENLIGQDDQAESRLRSKLVQWNAEKNPAGKPGVGPDAAADNPAILERLRDLGYL